MDPDGIPATADEYYAYDAGGKGVFLHNFGATAPKTITVSGTNAFNANASNGLLIYTKGLVTLNNITANLNACNPAYDIDTIYCAGAYIYSQSGVKQTGYGMFWGNTRRGLEIINNTKGSVALNNIDARDNGSAGISEGVFVDAFNSTYAIPVSITGVNVFSVSYNDGLYISASGAVSVSNATANSNGGIGIHIENYAPYKAPVTLLGQTNTSFNVDSGVFIYSYGAVKTNGIYARSNGTYGAYINNCQDVLGSCAAPAVLPVTMNGDNVFLSNNSSNLYVVSRGAITVNNLISRSSSLGYGAWIDNQYANAVGGVTLKGYVRAEYNDSDNIIIYSNGAVSAANVMANNSTNGGGLYIHNAVAAMPAVTITGYNQFNNNYANGLRINSRGAVSVSNITARLNGNPSGATGAYITNTGGTSPRAVILSGVNTFSDNFDLGLSVSSGGAITVYNITSKYNGNGGGGAYLDNQSALSNQPITLLGYGVFDSNSGSGLDIRSKGNVTLTNLTAKQNALEGAYIESYNAGSASVAANVILTGNNFFRGNGSDGLNILNDGNITVSNINAFGNGNHGANLDNLWPGTGEVKNITVSGVNNFFDNVSIGLRVASSGNATLTRVQSGYNFNPGVPMSDGLYTSVAGTLTLTCGKFIGNEGSGFYLNAAIIKLAGFISNGNGAADFTNVAPITTTRVCALP